MTHRRLLVCGCLLAAWTVVLGWQVAEHARVSRTSRAALINRAKDISGTLGIVIRSQRRFGGLVSKERLESALNDLVKQGELSGVALLNASDEVVASAGENFEPPPRSVLRTGAVWERQNVTLMNLVDLGTNVTADLEGTNPPIVLPTRDMFPHFDTNRPPGPPRGFERPPGDDDGPRERSRPPPNEREFGRPRFVRPFWMSEDEYKTVIQKQGVHSFVLAMSTASLRALTSQDLWLRCLVVLLASISAIGVGVAWRNLDRSSDLQLRLVRASELATHLRELNLAAAGLAHETRNPLNIIRGFAQMISRSADAPPEVRTRASEILEETDRVTAQLNEFINYSRPREVRRAALSIETVAADVARALGCDLEDKHAHLQIKAEHVQVEADEALLRQAVFNLLMNAIQAVEPGGEIQVLATKTGPAEAQLEIRDNGPGVPPERREEVFKPYFTTQKKGAGLGLAVVQQIVLAHGWEIHCLPNEPRGAIFRITHLKLRA
ncbi:MAG: ATP-binding protein [Verrucomicrobiota bacterium]|jgi:signal transduction histidine kinase